MGRAIGDLALDDEPAGPVEQTPLGGPHHQRGHEVLEHRARPRDERGAELHRRHRPPEPEPVLRRHLAPRHREEARQPRLRCEEIVAPLVEDAIGHAIADGEELPRLVEEEGEVHRLAGQRAPRPPPPDAGRRPRRQGPSARAPPRSSPRRPDPGADRPGIGRGRPGPRARAPPREARPAPPPRVGIGAEQAARRGQAATSSAGSVATPRREFPPRGPARRDRAGGSRWSPAASRPTRRCRRVARRRGRRRARPTDRRRRPAPAGGPPTPGPSWARRQRGEEPVHRRLELRDGVILRPRPRGGSYSPRSMRASSIPLAPRPPRAAGASAPGAPRRRRPDARPGCRCPRRRCIEARAGAGARVVPVVEVSAEPLEPPHGRRVRLEPVDHIERPDPAEVARGHRRQQVQTHVGRRSPVGDHRLGSSWKLSGGSAWSSGPTKTSKKRQLRRATVRSMSSSSRASGSAGRAPGAQAHPPRQPGERSQRATRGAAMDQACPVPRCGDHTRRPRQRDCAPHAPIDLGEVRLELDPTWAAETHSSILRRVTRRHSVRTTASPISQA